MNIYAKNTDTSNELVISRYRNGIKLIKPDFHGENSSFGTVKSILQMLSNVFFINKANIIEASNESTANFNKYDSVNEFIGKGYHDFPDVSKDTIIKAMHNNKKVIATNNPMVIVEECSFLDSPRLELMTIKLPWYNENDHIAGIFGFSFQLDKNQIAVSCDKMINLFLSNIFLPFFNPPQNKKHDIHFTSREHDCLRLIVKGKTAKEIGIILGVSFRTIECYLENIKNKMKVKTKSQLIEKAIDYLGN